MEVAAAANRSAQPAWRAGEGVADDSGRLLFVGSPVVGTQSPLFDLVEPAEVHGFLHRPPGPHQ